MTPSQKQPMTLHEFTDLLTQIKGDYHQRYHLDPIIEPESEKKLRAFSRDVHPACVRAAWNLFIDSAEDDDIDIRKFLYTNTFQRYTRIAVARFMQSKRKANDECYFYHCENCNNQSASSTDLGDVLPSPCHYCQSRMIRRETFERDRPLSPGAERIKQRMINQNPIWIQIYELWDKYPDKTLRQIQEMLPPDAPKAKIGFQNVVDKLTGKDALDKNFL